MAKKIVEESDIKDVDLVLKETPVVVERPLKEVDVEEIQFNKTKGSLKVTILELEALIKLRDEKGVNSIVYCNALDRLKLINNRLLVR